MPFTLDGKITVVTGGCRGIGLNAAIGFAEAGAAKIYITARDEKALAEAVETINAAAKAAGKSGQAHAIVADLSTSEGVKLLVSSLAEREKQIDVLFANAGVATEIEADNDDIDARFNQLFGVNVRSIYQLIMLLKPLLAAGASAKQTSSVIITGSLSGTIKTSMPGLPLYGASKAAVHHLTGLLAKTLAPEHIRVNSIACGLFPTRMGDGIDDETQNALLNMTPLGRFGEPDDIKDSTVFLGSSASAYITGEVIHVDGGARL